jgi:flavin reductase (DIM6/NTAB) family NADH-FMN oxidoreductase RutF
MMPVAVKDDVSKALGRIPSGCFVVTASDAGNSTGVLASWVQQAGFDPPAVTVAIRHGRPIRDLIDRSGRFVVNTLGEDCTHILKRFAAGVDPDEPVFQGLRSRTEPAGVVLEDAISSLSCRVIGELDAGDHTVYVGTVIDGDVRRSNPPCVRIRTNGFNY